MSRGWIDGIATGIGVPGQQIANDLSDVPLAAAGAIRVEAPTAAEVARVRAGIEAHKAAENARDAALADRLDALASDAHAIAGELRGRPLTR